jgi:cell division protein FtsB
VATQVAAAAELRRLHAEVEALKLENNNLRWLSMRMTPAKAEEVKP